MRKQLLQMILNTLYLELVPGQNKWLEHQFMSFLLKRVSHIASEKLRHLVILYFTIE